MGDLHFDRLEHHDLNWLQEHKPGDLSQIKNYSRITAEITPQLFGAVKRTLSKEPKPAFVLQVGDLVEGLCGSEALATRQDQDALAMIGSAELGVPSPRGTTM